VPPVPTLALQVTTYQELLALSGGDPYVRYGVPDPLRGAAFHRQGAIAVERKGRLRHGLAAFGPQQALDRLLDALVEADVFDGLGLRSLSVPQGLEHVAERHLDLGDGGRWDWMWTTSEPPAGPADHLVITLDDEEDAADIAALTAAHSPTAEGYPGTGASERWVGIREDGRVVAAGALQRLESGAAHLAGIVVDPARRGHGYGRAVTAALTGWAVRREGVCTLGMYSDNPAARHIYTTLGYRTAYAWDSRRLVRH
jgi:ribosomal protein S18 acetylase RimI-like enzyme